MADEKTPQCVYCDHALCCERCGREQPADDVTALREFVREVVAIDPKAGSGEGKYFVTADFIARARALAYP